MEFEIKLEYTIDDIQAYWRSFVQKKPEQKKPETASPRQMAWVGVFFLAAGLLTMAVLESVLMSVLELILGVTLLIASRKAGQPQGPVYARGVRRMWKKYQEAGPLYSCCFTEDGVWIHDCKSDHRYDYAYLDALWEDGERFYLALPENRGIYVLNKERFTKGNPTELPAFWESRTGKPVKPVE